MGLDEAVSISGLQLVAGIGFRRRTETEEIVGLVRRALALIPGELQVVATAADRAGEAALRRAAETFGLVPVAVEPEALAAVDSRVPTRSVRIEASRGVGSVAEAAALAAAGEGAVLVLPRIASAGVTCALAARPPEARG
jgi:cobalt-precorrin 5A hydrolase